MQSFKLDLLSTVWQIIVCSVFLLDHWTEWLTCAALWQSLLSSIQFDLSGDNFCCLAGILISFRWVECSVNQTKQRQRIVCLQQATRQSAECCQRAEYEYSSTWNGHVRQADADRFLRPWEGRWVQASFIVCTKVHISFVYVSVFDFVCHNSWRAFPGLHPLSDILWTRIGDSVSWICPCPLLVVGFQSDRSNWMGTLHLRMVADAAPETLCCWFLEC